MTPLDITFWTGWTVTAAAITVATTTGAHPWLVPAALLAWLIALAVTRICEHQP
ncbi:hypothetical protein AB0F17_43305 [Nonomuraea sp. NPDC026600]|uniref:hypothetical protein n=1 Tax=Nonomuraea sp. NPDC026600 TaxID=3155363 RepID=UPI0033C36AD2